MFGSQYEVITMLLNKVTHTYLIYLMQRKPSHANNLHDFIWKTIGTYRMVPPNQHFSLSAKTQRRVYSGAYLGGFLGVPETPKILGKSRNNRLSWIESKNTCRINGNGVRRFCNRRLAFITQK